MTIYICTPIASGDRTKEQVRQRVEELTERLSSKGYDAVSHLDNDNGGKWADKVGGNVALILSSDGILLDHDRKVSRVCVIEETVAKTVPTWKHFIFLHTKEEYERILENYVI